MTDEDKQALRAMMVEVVGSAIGALEGRLEDRFLEFEAEIALLHDRFDSLEIELKDARTHGVKVSRAQILERLKREKLEKRLVDLEQKDVTARDKKP